MRAVKDSLATPLGGCRTEKALAWPNGASWRAGVGWVRRLRALEATPLASLNTGDGLISNERDGRTGREKRRWSPTEFRLISLLQPAPQPSKAPQISITFFAFTIRISPNSNASDNRASLAAALA